MLRLSKLTDYGVLLMSELAKSPDTLCRAPDLAVATQIPQPTVSKVMAALQHASLVTSIRGAHGGYQLQRPAHDISIRALIQALEGSLSLTDCEESGDKACEQLAVCGTRHNWLKINQAMRDALQNISLQDMVSTDFSPIFTMRQTLPIQISQVSTGEVV